VTKFLPAQVTNTSALTIFILFAFQSAFNDEKVRDLILPYKLVWQSCEASHREFSGAKGGNELAYYLATKRAAW